MLTQTATPISDLIGMAPQLTLPGDDAEKVKSVVSARTATSYNFRPLNHDSFSWFLCLLMHSHDRTLFHVEVCRFRTIFLWREEKFEPLGLLFIDVQMCWLCVSPSSR